MSFTTHKEQIEAFMSEQNADVSKIKTCVEEVIEAVIRVSFVLLALKTASGQLTLGLKCNYFISEFLK